MSFVTKNIQHPYIGFYNFLKHCKEEFQTENVNDYQNQNQNQNLSLNQNQNQVTNKKASRSFSAFLLYFFLILLVFLFFLVTGILGLYHSIQCKHTVWTVLNVIGFFTGIPFGTFYYFFVKCTLP